MLNELYQTLEDRNNVDEVERSGPFKCNRDTAWLGKGYYYWDTFIEYAHWWGDVVYRKNQHEYLICQSTVEFNNENLYDLLEPNNLNELDIISAELEKQYPKKTITVGVVLTYIKEHSKAFTYKAVRARVENATNYQMYPIAKHCNFPRKGAYLDLKGL